MTHGMQGPSPGPPQCHVPCGPCTDVIRAHWRCYACMEALHSAVSGGCIVCARHLARARKSSSSLSVICQDYSAFYVYIRHVIPAHARASPTPKCPKTPSLHITQSAHPPAARVSSESTRHTSPYTVLPRSGPMFVKPATAATPTAPQASSAFAAATPSAPSSCHP